METSSKKDLAVSFLKDLGKMEPERLRMIISKQVGEELAAVMFNYARQVIEASPDKAIENASSLLILGYLLKVHEDGAIPPENPPV
ncbi:MAG: hypothetical protein JRJ87_06855 [Deltaproteobacteria bacterium]|nr:hypothetical protein [Deltaproteobacteria bacterium]